MFNPNTRNEMLVGIPLIHPNPEQVCLESRKITLNLTDVDSVADGGTAGSLFPIA
jgi:hypothetical protein